MGVRELPCVVAVAAAVVGVCGDVCSCILLHVGGMFFECVSVKAVSLQPFAVQRRLWG